MRRSRGSRLRGRRASSRSRTRSSRSRIRSSRSRIGRRKEAANCRGICTSRMRGGRRSRRRRSRQEQTDTPKPQMSGFLGGALRPTISLISSKSQPIQTDIFL